METLPGFEDYNKPKRGKQKIQQVVAKKSYVNTVTGEVEDFTVIQKNVYSDFNFHKIWLEDLLNILNSIGNRKIIILSYLLKIMRNEDNSLNFTMRSLSKATGVSLPTCQSTINELLEANVLRRDTEIAQLYMFNPDIIVKGHSAKRQKLLIEYVYDDTKKDIQSTRKMLQ